MTGARGTVAVVGGGIFGAFAGYWLALRGDSVVIVDDPDAVSASRVNPGCLNPLHGAGVRGSMRALALQSLALHRHEWDRLTALSRVAFKRRPSTRVVLALDIADEQRLQAFREPYDDEPGFSATWLEPDELLALEPRLSPSLRGGLRTTGDAKVDAGDYTRAVLGSAVALGAQVVPQTATGLTTAGDRATAVELPEGSIRCEAVVIATGPRPAELLGLELRVRPVKGELLRVELEDPTDVLWRQAAVYAHDERTAWIGGTEIEGTYDPQPTAAGRAQIQHQLGEVWPGIEHARVLDHVAGLRAVTPDELPIVGPAPGWANVCLALGGGRKGMLLSAAVGLACCELLRQGETSLPIEPCSPTRPALAETTLTEAASAQ